MKTQGSLQEQIRKLLRPCVIIFTVLIILHGAATLLYVPHVAAALERSPGFTASPPWRSFPSRPSGSSSTGTVRAGPSSPPAPPWAA
ncbi:hypothetical protein M5E88_15770 [Akkermansia muciniphila]|nr:hypothetical protein M5E88_15770 [Akkermansia muciniphila]